MSSRSRVVLFGALVTALVLAPATAASAHDQLIGSSPGNGERLEVAPTEVLLQFDNDVMDIGAIVLVVDESGRDWVVGDPRISRSDVTIGLDSDMPDAGYQVRWQVVSKDGHPISGVIPFTIGDGEEFVSTGAQTGDGQSASAPQSQAPDEQTAIVRLVIIGAIGAAIAVAVLALILYHGRRTRRDAGTAS